MIESLQEQVNNAKEKLVKLMSAECTQDPSKWAVSTSSFHSKHILASPQNLADKEPLENPGDSQNDTSTAAQGYQDPSIAISSIPSLKGPGQKETVSDLKDLSGHLNLGSSQKSGIEKNQGTERRDEIPKTFHQRTAGESSVPQRQGQLENSEKPQERLTRVDSVIREKLQEVLQDLGLGSEVPNPSSPSIPQQPWKNKTDLKSQNIPFSKELGFSPYMVRRRRATPRAHLHFPGSRPSNGGHQENRTVSGVHRGLTVQNRERPNLDAQTTTSRVPRRSSRKPVLLSGRQGKLVTLDSSRSDQVQLQAFGSSTSTFPCQPSETGQAQSPTSASLDLQLQPLESPRGPPLPFPGNYFDTESSSSDEFFCHCHRPYCEICFQSSSDSSDSGSSETDPEQTARLSSWEKHWSHSKPVVNFKDDLKPTLV